MELDLLTLFLKYPLIKLQKSDNNYRKYTGYLSDNAEDYEVKILERLVDKIYIIKVKHSQTTIINNIETTCHDNIIECLDNIKYLIKEFKETHSSTTRNDDNNSKPIYNNYRIILHEYHEFIKFHLNLNKHQITSDLNEINLSTFDNRKREHFLKIRTNVFEENKQLFEPVEYDLPAFGDELLLKPANNLSSIYKEFVNYLEIFQPYFDIMEIFDESCSIIDPKSPRRAQNYRRVALGENVSVVITFNPFDLTSNAPNFKFLGLERLIEKFRRQLNENLENWDEKTNDIYQEILKMLNLSSFPLGTDSINESNELLEANECSICFLSNLNNKMPEIICKNTTCERFYHSECLSKWFISINNRRIFNEISGPCPNCEKPISCPINQ